MNESAERKITARTKFYIDTEFIESGPSFPLILLSIGIVEENGRELYLVNADAPLELANDWVRKNVIPYLGPSSTSIREFGAIIREWIGVQRPEFWGYYADYDWVVFCQIFGSMIDLPKGWPMFCRDIKQLCVECGDPELPEQSSTEHNALNDARWNKLAHEFLLASSERREPPAASVSASKPAAMITSSRIKEIIEDHETNYNQRTDGKWDWSCACGLKEWFHERDFAIDMTRAHWADAITKEFRAASVSPVGPEPAKKEKADAPHD